MLERMLLDLVAKYSPGWALSYSEVRLREPGVVELRGALPTTLHFGSARLTLATGELLFVDEDHRDGGDFEEARVIVTADELARVKEAAVHHGSCICGAVRFEVVGPLKAPDACHCTVCRKWSGHYYVGSDVQRSALTIHGVENVKWFHSSEKVRRGFCATCGSSLFFDPVDHTKHAWIGVSMGAFDDATQTKIAFHIFVENKGDYYEIKDGLPQFKRTP
jgi:hypothetical protein